MKKNIATMSGSNCYTNSGVVKVVLSEGSPDSSVCHGPCSAPSFLLLLCAILYADKPTVLCGIS